MKQNKDLLENARKGNLEVLFNLMDCDVNNNNDRDAYKWLWVARDLSCKKIDALIDDILEVSSLRYDDNNDTKANVHCKLALAYLNGDGGFPIDLYLAEEHLKMASEYIDLRDFITQVISNFKGQERKLLETYRQSNFDTNLIQSIKDLSLLREANAPKVIIDNQEEFLKQTFKIFIENN